MIVYRLRCSGEHTFEGWFRDQSGFDSANAGGHVSCPFCGDTTIRRLPTAARVQRERANPNEIIPTSADDGAGDGDEEIVRTNALTRLVTEMRQYVEVNFENAGRNFPEEARRIHYGEREARGIYGEATEEEANELREEGISISPLPWISRRND